MFSMNILPIQVVDGGVLIPLEYLQNAREFEVERREGYVVVRPKTNGSNGHTHAVPTEIDQEDDALTQRLREKYPWVGMAKNMDPRTSIDAEEILSAETSTPQEPNQAAPSPKLNWLQEISGMAETSDPTASGRVKEILMAEIDRRSGWTEKPPLLDSE